MSTLPLFFHSFRLPVPRPRTLKLVALAYALKTAAFGVAWYFVPDLPERLLSGTQAAWAWLVP